MNNISRKYYYYFTYWSRESALERCLFAKTE
jgi:hypothetical protein